MKEILEKLLGSFKNGDYFSGAVIVMVALIFNFKKIVEFLEERKKARLLKLTEALKCEYLQGISKSHIEEELATEHFKSVTGIRLEKEFREAIIKAHRDTNGELSFKHFKRALPYIYYKNSSLTVCISPFEWVGYLFNLICGFLLVLLGLLIIMQINQINEASLLQTLKGLGIGIFYIFIAFSMFFYTFPLLSALKIKKTLKTN